MRAIDRNLDRLIRASAKGSSRKNKAALTLDLVEGAAGAHFCLLGRASDDSQNPWDSGLPCLRLSDSRNFVPTLTLTDLLCLPWEYFLEMS